MPNPPLDDDDHAPVTGEVALLAFLDAHGLAYTRVEHPPVYTCEEAAAFLPGLHGVETKNLFLADEQGRFFLVMTHCAKRLDLKALARALEARKLAFATPEQLLAVLGLTPGAVTVLALVNDRGGQVTLLVDADDWPAAAYLCHPLVNTATLVIDHSVLARFLALTGHPPRVVAMPGRPA